jgi:hypothetical protein
MRRHGERFRTPNDWREILFKRSDVELATAMFVQSRDLSRPGQFGTSTAAKLRILGGIKQCGARLSGRASAKMLIGELCRHPAAGRAIQEANLDQVWFDDFFNRIFLFMNRG